MQSVRAIVLVSGGIDSAVALWWTRRQGWEILPLTFDYHRRSQRETQAARDLLTREERRRLREVPVPFLREVDDLGDALANPYLRDAPSAYIPARNLIYYSIAAHYAEAALAGWIVGGHNRHDMEHYPDAGERFFNGFNALCRSALHSARRAPIRVVLPLKECSKADVLRLGVKLGVPFESTWSCYWDGDAPCAACDSCRERARAFSEIGVADPLVERSLS